MSVNFQCAGACGDRPMGSLCRSDDFQRVNGLFLAVDPQTQAGAVEKTALRIKPGGTHRVVVGVHLVGHSKALAWPRIHFPLVFVQLAQGHGIAVLCGLQIL